MKYVATATRKNVSGKPDYLWVYRDTSNSPVLFETERSAFEKAESMCKDESASMHSPAARGYSVEQRQIMAQNHYLSITNQIGVGA